MGGGTWNYKIYFADSPINKSFLYPMIESSSENCEFGNMQALTVNSEKPLFADELGMNHFVEGTKFFSGDENSYAKDAKRWLLIDEACFSTAESFVGFCKDTGWAAVVGRRGLGDGDDIMPFTMRLEQTGLLIRFSTTSRANADGSLNVEM